MTTIEELEKQIEDLFKQSRELDIQRHELEKQVEAMRILFLMESGVLSTWKWEYRVTGGKYQYIYADIVAYPKELKTLLEWDHDSVDITSDVELGWSDGDVYIRFDNINALKSFAESNKLDIDFSTITDPIKELTQQLESFVKIANQFGMSLK